MGKAQWRHIHSEMWIPRGALLDRLAVEASYVPRLRQESSAAEAADQAREDARNLAEIVKAAAQVYDFRHVASGARDIFRELYGRELVQSQVSALGAEDLRAALAAADGSRVVSARVDAIREVACELALEARERERQGT